MRKFRVGEYVVAKDLEGPLMLITGIDYTTGKKGLQKVYCKYWGRPGWSAWTGMNGWNQTNFTAKQVTRVFPCEEDRQPFKQFWCTDYLEVGDLVKHKTGGPTMIVEGPRKSYIDDEEGPVELWCRRWSDKDKQFMANSFPEACLTKIK